ncbi:MAG TPA: hypothetical protein VEX69_00490 [Candidatus Limnocylindria bacterium]|nr:hypothetical protein [Candidatus Limnocylindria bacterium]
MFYYESMFNTALNGIVSAGLMSTVLTVAYGILLASLLFSAYEAWTKGGDVRALGVAGVKYLALGALFMNDGAVYERVFRDVLGAFNQISHTMAGAGPTDVFNAWRNDLFAYGATTGTFLNLVTAGMPALLSALLLLIAMIVYPVAYALFAVFYSLYGTILFVTGPLVLALMPSFGLGSLARRYAVNVMIFASWGLIYGIFCRLAIAINVNSMAALTSANSFAGALAGASQEVLLAVASVLFSVCILLIPVLAKRIVEGDLGGSMLTVLGAATTMAQSLMSMAAGVSGGMQGAAAGGGGGAGAGSGVGVAAASSNTAPAGPSTAGGGAGGSAPFGGSRSPRGPSGSGRGPGDLRPPNIPHAAGWLGGALAAVAMRGGQNAVAAGRKMLGAGEQTAATPTVSTASPGPESVDEWV